MEQDELKNNQKKILSASELIKLNLPKVKWIINDVLPSGLTILAGRPKSGKSFLALDLGITVTSGSNFLGKYKSNVSNVLYISNEDSYNRLQDRINKIILSKAIDDQSSLENIYTDTDFPILNDYGLSVLKNIIIEKQIDLVIIDTFFKQAYFPKGNKNYYAKEYETTGILQTFARETNICMLLVHHTRKGVVDNISDAILGTTGISGSADTIWIVDKQTGKTILEIEGKDVEPQSLSIEFKDFIWQYKGEYIENFLTPERKEILALIIKTGRPMQTSEIANSLGKQSNNISTLLKKMVSEGVIKNVSYGLYSI